MAFMPTRYLRTERDDVEQFFIDLSVKPAHDGEWRKVGQWNKDGSLSLCPQGEALTDEQAATFAGLIYTASSGDLDATDDEALAIYKAAMTLSAQQAGTVEPDWNRTQFPENFGFATPKAAPADPRTDPAWEQRTSDYAEGYRDGKAAPAAVSDEQILACLDDREPARTHHGAAVFEYRLFALVAFARRVLALSSPPSVGEPSTDGAKPAGEPDDDWGASPEPVFSDQLVKFAWEAWTAQNDSESPADPFAGGVRWAEKMLRAKAAPAVQSEAESHSHDWKYNGKLGDYVCACGAIKGDIGKGAAEPVAQLTPDDEGNEDYRLGWNDCLTAVGKMAPFSPDWANYQQGLKDGAQAAGQEDAEAMRMLWDDQPLEEKEHYRRAASGGAKG